MTAALRGARAALGVSPQDPAPRALPSALPPTTPKTHYSAAELVGLPGLPTSVWRITQRAKRQKWPREKRQGRGGGWVYPISALPMATQRVLFLRHGMASAPAADATPANDDPAARSAHLWRVFEARPQKMKDEAARRLRALDTVEHMIIQGSSKMAAIATVAEHCDEHPNTIRNWFKLVDGVKRSDWLPALCPRHAGRQISAECSPEAWDQFKGDYLRLSQPAEKACYARLLRTAEVQGWKVPSLKTLMRRLAREIPPAAIVLARQGREAVERMYPAQERDHSIFRALEAVNADGHKLDVFAKFDDGEITRPVLLAWQCIYSGKILAWRIGKTECVELIRLAFADLVEKFGIPDHAYLDNGRGFASKWMTGRMANRFRFKIKDEEPAGILTQIGVKVHWATPYHGQSKPIERAFRDLCEYVARHPRCDGAYTGNRPDAKPENYGSKALPMAELHELVAEEIAQHNARLGRESAVCNGRSFDQVFNESYATAPIKRASEAQRQLFLLAADGVTAAAGSGVIRLYENRYWTESLGAVAGRKVIVRFDPQHLDRPVHVYGRDGRFIATAQLIEKSGFNDVDAAREHARNRKQFVKAQRAALEAERKLTASDVAAQLPKMQPGATPTPAIVRPVFQAPRSALTPQPGEEISQRDFEGNISRKLQELIQKRAG